MSIEGGRGAGERGRSVLMEGSMWDQKREQGAFWNWDTTWDLAKNEGKQDWKSSNKNYSCLLSTYHLLGECYFTWSSWKSYNIVAVVILILFLKKRDRKVKSFGLVLYLGPFFFCGAGDGTEGLSDARHALNPWAPPSAQPSSWLPPSYTCWGEATQGCAGSRKDFGKSLVVTWPGFCWGIVFCLECRGDWREAEGCKEIG